MAVPVFGQVVPANFMVMKNCAQGAGAACALYPRWCGEGVKVCEFPIGFCREFRGEPALTIDFASEKSIPKWMLSLI